jgi:hypothetical protein
LHFPPDRGRYLVVIVVALLMSGCATYETRGGRSGPVAWELVDKNLSGSRITYTVVLRETAGVGISFATIRTVSPVPSTGYGREYYGGIREQPFVRRLEAKAELRTSFTAPTSQRYVEIEFRGKDDTGKPVQVTLRLQLE